MPAWRLLVTYRPCAGNIWFTDVAFAQHARLHEVSNAVILKTMTADSASGQSRTWQTGAFTAIALGLGTMTWIAGNGALAPHTRHVMTMALSFDLLVTLPGSYYLLVARPRGQRWWTVVGVALLAHDHRAAPRSRSAGTCRGKNPAARG